jgi:hypothetical protein
MTEQEKMIFATFLLVCFIAGKTFGDLLIGLFH